MAVLIVINDPPYGTEKPYNALRLAITLKKEHAESQVWVFLMADAVFCALPGQSTSPGYYNVERMLQAVLRRGGIVKACGTCLEARGLGDAPLIEGVLPSNMAELAALVSDAEKVLSF